MKTYGIYHGGGKIVGYGNLEAVEESEVKNKELALQIQSTNKINHELSNRLNKNDLKARINSENEKLF